MKDNYSWLDETLNNLYFGYKYDYVDTDPKRNTGGVSRLRIKKTVSVTVDQAKQTIISQIEIEKLRARIEAKIQVTTITLNSEIVKPEYHNLLVARLADLTEKLKELEGK